MAYKSLDRGRLVVVVMNRGMKSEEVELHCTNGGGVNILDVYETSATNDLKAMSHGMQNNMYSSPAESVSTLVTKGSGGKQRRGNF